MHAIVLAGQPNQGRLRQVSGAAYEAEILIQGRRMADFVLDAVEASALVTSRALVGPEGFERPGVTRVPIRGGLLDNVLAGLATVPPGATAVLFLTSDIPWITGDIIDEFLRLSPRDVDVVYPVIPRAVAEARFPGTRRTYIRVKDGVFTGGNLFLVNPAILPALAERGQKLLSHRKSPWKLAQDLGFGFLWRFLTGRLSLTQIEAEAGSLLGVQGKALIFPYAEAGVDVDKPEDLALAERAVRFSQATGWGRP